MLNMLNRIQRNPSNSTPYDLLAVQSHIETLAAALHSQSARLQRQAHLTIRQTVADNPTLRAHPRLAKYATPITANTPPTPTRAGGTPHYRGAPPTPPKGGARG